MGLSRYYEPLSFMGKTSYRGSTAVKTHSSLQMEDVSGARDKRLQNVTIKKWIFLLEETLFDRATLRRLLPQPVITIRIRINRCTVCG